MSRVAAGTPIVVKASNNIYTALLGAATLATLAAVIVVLKRASEMGWNFFSV